MSFIYPVNFKRVLVHFSWSRGINWAHQTTYTCGFMNNFIDIGIFPDILKRGCITLIFKKGDSRFLGNYRPLSTLPIFGKIMKN